ncbi:molybdopterin biosynthesis protein [Halobaculum sp. MBLA0143]|uniref:molybdopterin biosynthesis protein n=1 Tax=Halobaculum sp. MBLA0143 TaxID=3079933 RepID=UPI003523475B
MTDRKQFRDLIDPETARETIADLEIAPPPETVPPTDARERVLAERVDAGIDVPGFDRAAVDGYAVRAADTAGADADPVELPLTGTVHAGETPATTVESGACVEVSTGAVLPDGADAVVMVEDTDEPTQSSADDADRADGETGTDTTHAPTVTVRTAVAPGDHVGFAGEDVAAGARALGPGTRVGPQEVALLSALGVAEVPVRGRPTVGIVSTGEELVRPETEPNHARGEIHDVNAYTVAAGVEEAGGDAEIYPHVSDNVSDLAGTLREAATECDLVVSSGSTSASAVDVVYRVIEEQGELLFHGVAIKPGKPTLAGRLDGTPYVGLPGYPVSAATIFRTFVAPAIRSAAGLPEPATATVDGRMAVRQRTEEGRRRLLSVGLVEDGAGETLVYPVDRGSGATTSLVNADGVVSVHPDTTYLAAGERVTVQTFGADARPPTVFGVGEDDPAVSRLLDRLDRPRYLAEGSRRGLRELRAGVPDVAVTAGPVDGTGETAGATDAGDAPDAGDAAEVGGWTRDWGLLVPAGNPRDVRGIADLIDRDLRLVARDNGSGLQTSLANAVAALADERGVDRHDAVAAIDGYDRGLRAHESPARRVLADDADAGLGLRVTADRLDVSFVPVDDQRVRVWAATDRLDKPGVERLRDAVDAGVADGLAGYRESTD